MANRFLAAIERYNAKAATVDPAKITKLHEGLKTPWSDLVQYQQLQSHAFASGKLSSEEAQTLYRMYGGETPSAAKWDRLSIGEKVVGTKVASELLEMAARRRNLFDRPSTVICPLCRETVHVRPEEDRTEALLKHLQRIKHNPKRGRKNPRQSLYESFHGAPPQRTRKVNVPRPTSPLIAIGRATRIEYQPYGSSRHKNIRYYHDFGDIGGSMLKVRPILATDAKGKNLFLIPGSKKYPRFSSRGILG